MQLPQTTCRGTPRKARCTLGGLFGFHRGQFPEGKLTFEGVVIGFHGQGQSHAVPEKGLRRDFAAVDAHARTTRFFQKPTALHQQALTLRYSD